MSSPIRTQRTRRSSSITDCSLVAEFNVWQCFRGRPKMSSSNLRTKSTTCATSGQSQDTQPLDLEAARSSYIGCLNPSLIVQFTCWGSQMTSGTIYCQLGFQVSPELIRQCRHGLYSRRPVELKTSRPGQS